MNYWLQFVLLAASAFAHAPEPMLVLPDLPTPARYRRICDTDGSPIQYRYSCRFVRIGQAALGFGEGAWETVSGLASAVWNIDQTVAGLWNAATHPLQTVDALSVALAEYADLALGGDPEAIGRGVFELAAMAVPVTKARYAGAVGELTRTVSVADELALAARRAAASVGPGKGPVYGIKVHAAFRKEVNALGNPALKTEVSFLGKEEVKWGTPGSVRVDVVHYGPSGEILGIYDLKTGGAVLTPQRAEEIVANIPAKGSVPITTIKP